MGRHILQRHGLWIGWTIVAIIYFWRRYSHSIDAGAKLYREGAECLLQHVSIVKCSLPFTYPPFFAFTMLPATALPYWLWVMVWYVVTIIGAIVCCKIAERLAVSLFPGEWSEQDLNWLRFLAGLFSLRFILAVFEDQAFDLFSLPFLLYGLLALTQRMDIRAGAALAIAAALKVTPLIFLPYLIFRRRFVATAAFTVALLVASFLPDLVLRPHDVPHGNFVDWFNHVVAPSVGEGLDKNPFWSGNNPYNLSFRGLIAQHIDESAQHAQFILVLRTVQLVFIALIGVLFLFAYRCPALIPVEGALLIIAALMLSPMTGRGHFVGLVLPFFLLVAAYLKDHHTRRLGFVILVLTFAGTTGIPRDIVPKAITAVTGDLSNIMFGTLVEIIYLAVIMIRPEYWNIRCGQDDRRNAVARPVAVAHRPD